MVATKTGNTTYAETRLIVAKRSLNATSEKFTPLPQGSQKILASEDRVKLSSLTQLDGQYVLLVR